MNPGPFLCLALWNQNERRQGATLPVTREWPTKSLVSGTENVPALLSMGAGVRSLEATIYIYMYVSHSCVWLFGTNVNLGHSCVWPIGNKAILVSGSLAPTWTLGHSCVWLFGTKMNLGHNLFFADFFAECIFDYLDYFRLFGLFRWLCRRRIWHILLKIVDVDTIQDQICMFQDSVPAGSYNDPFLSSVCVCVSVCLCVTSK